MICSSLYIYGEELPATLSFHVTVDFDRSRLAMRSEGVNTRFRARHGLEKVEARGVAISVLSIQSVDHSDDVVQPANDTKARQPGSAKRQQPST